MCIGLGTKGQLDRVAQMFKPASSIVVPTRRDELLTMERDRLQVIRGLTDAAFRAVYVTGS